MAEAIAVLPLQGRLTMNDAMAFVRDAESRLAGADKTLDLGGLTQVDSAALAALLDLSRRHSVQFSNPPGNLKKLATLYGVASLLFP